MIPQLVTVGWRRPDGRWRRLHVPVLPILLVLSPPLLVAVLGGLIVGVFFDVSPMGALRGAGRLVCALPGTRFELEQGRTGVLVSVR